MTVRLVGADDAVEHLDPRDPVLYRSGISSARAQLRDARARHHARLHDEREDQLDGADPIDMDDHTEGARDA